MKPLYEVTLAGFDGSTDATDHKVLWVASVSHSLLSEVLTECKARATITRIHGVHGVQSDDIDFTLPADLDRFKLRLQREQ